MAKRSSVTDMAYSQDEFGRESRHLELLVWDNLVIEKGHAVLFCGFGTDGELVKKAIRAEAIVTVIESRDEEMRKHAGLGARILRGSTSVIPAKNDSFDVAVAYHYLHEIDPFFHSQVVIELGRVGKRVVVVEPAPPSDMLGRRISMLYSRAKRELGQFEYYQTLEYWKKLLSMVKSEVSTTVLSFTKPPPTEYLIDTVELLLDTMRVEAAPQFYLDQLREIAERSDSPLLPQARFILAGAAVGQIPKVQIRERAAPPPDPEQVAAAAVKRLRGTPIDPQRQSREYNFPADQNAPIAPAPLPVPSTPARPAFAAPVPTTPTAPPSPFAPPTPAAPFSPFGAPKAPPFSAPQAPPQPNVNQPAQPTAPFGFPPPTVPLPAGPQAPPGFPPPFAPPPAPPGQTPFGMPNPSFPGAGGTGIDQPPPGWRWEPPEDDD